MADIITSYKQADAYGRAAFEEMDRYLQSVLLAGAEPALEPAETYQVKESSTLELFRVVGFEGNVAGAKLVPAVLGTTAAIGVMAHAVTAGASGVVPGHVWRIGVFNIGTDSPLVWDATYNTIAKKKAAFEGAPSPTRIIARERLTPAS